MLSIIFSIIAIFSQKTGQSTMVSLTDIPFLTRVGNALVSYMAYLHKTVWPFELAIIYPYQPIEIWRVVISILLLLSISVYAFIVRKKHPYLIFGWLWFLITLLPVIGLIQVGSQSMADRYTYVPLIGIFIAAVWGAHSLIKKFQVHRKIAIISGVVLILTSSKITMSQVTTWQKQYHPFQPCLIGHRK